MTALRAVLDGARRQLADSGVDSAALDARLLLQHLTGLAHSDIIANPDLPVAHEQVRAFEHLLARRLRHEPVSRILGMREFYGRPFAVTGAVLDPRPDTETLIEAALRNLQPAARILDLGTGSGAIIVTLLAEAPQATGVAADLSPAALSVARCNAQRLSVLPRLELVESDWFSAIAGEFDMIVSNPPYIHSAGIAGLAPEVRNFDPHAALDGGTDGLDAFRAIAESASGFLLPGGHVLVEIGMGQEIAVSAIFTANGFLGLEHRRDLAGHVRCLVFAKS